ncbi:MAG: FHA domain-containing protein, partial [Planctomycetota bacterium]
SCLWHYSILYSLLFLFYSTKRAQDLMNALFQVIHQEGSRKGEVDNIHKVPAFIGCQNGVEVFFSSQKEPKVAKVHAKIDWVHGKWILEDLDSPTGLIVDGKPVAIAILKEKTTVQLGEGGPVLEIQILASPQKEIDSLEGMQKERMPISAKEKRPSSSFSNDEFAMMQDILKSLSWRIKLLYSFVFLLLCLLLGVTYFQLPFLSYQKKQDISRTTLKNLKAYFQKQLQKRKELQRRYEEEIQKLKKELDRLQKRKGENGKIASLENRLSLLAREIQLGENLSHSFKKIQKEYEKATLFIYMEMNLFDPKTGKVQRIDSFGTGFFLTSTGILVTNKHVIQPWKFAAFAQNMGRLGLVPLPDTQRIALWRSGTPFMTKDGHLDYSKGYNNFHLMNLQVLKTAPDSLKQFTAQERGQKYTYWAHLPDNHDLALLKVQSNNPLPFVKLGSSQKLEKLDPIMVLGYPRGMDIMERGIVQASPTLGTIRKVEDTIYVSASIIPGNSGGPLFSSDGKVVGICTRVYQGTETLGVCIKSRYIWQLLPPKIRKLPQFKDFLSR